MAEDWLSFKIEIFNLTKHTICFTVRKTYLVESAIIKSPQNNCQKAPEFEQHLFWKLRWTKQWTMKTSKQTKINKLHQTLSLKVCHRETEPWGKKVKSYASTPSGVRGPRPRHRNQAPPSRCPHWPFWPGWVSQPWRGSRVSVNRLRVLSWTSHRGKLTAFHVDPVKPRQSESFPEREKLHTDDRDSYKASTASRQVCLIPTYGTQARLPQSASPASRAPWARRRLIRTHPLGARPRLPHSRAPTSPVLGITRGVEVCSELIGGTTDKLDPWDSFLPQFFSQTSLLKAYTIIEKSNIHTQLLTPPGGNCVNLEVVALCCSNISTSQVQSCCH